MSVDIFVCEGLFMTFDMGSGAQFNKQMLHLFWRLQQHALGTYTNTTSFVLGETNAVFLVVF